MSDEKANYNECPDRCFWCASFDYADILDDRGTCNKLGRLVSATALCDFFEDHDVNDDREGGKPLNIETLTLSEAVERSVT